MDRFSPIYSPGRLSWFRTQPRTSLFEGARQGRDGDDIILRDDRDSLALTSQEVPELPDATIVVSRRLRSAMNLVPNLSFPGGMFSGMDGFRQHKKYISTEGITASPWLGGLDT